MVLHIETVDLSSRGVTFPRERVGMVIAQPFLELSDHEPFRCTAQAKPRMLSAISRTLAVARGNHHGEDRTHFTIFPEYTLCGIEGIKLIDDSVKADDWPRRTIVIAGTDALTKPEFEHICGQERTYLNAANALAGVQANHWINCQIIWIKDANGIVEKWLQPKVEPAWPEQDITCASMYRGQSVYTFRGEFEGGTFYRFSSLVCFDWIGSVQGTKIWRWVVDDLQRQATEAQAEYSLSWFFVIQSNRQPSHHTFLNEIAGFFQQNIAPAIHRSATCLVFANGGGKATPGIAELFGQTSLIFSPQAQFKRPRCHPTFSNGGANFRPNGVLNGFHDILFRERGACINSFAQINPGSIEFGAAGATLPLRNPFVFALSDTPDQRTPSGPVAASVKWMNDQLEVLPKLSKYHPQCPLALASDSIHNQTVSALRQEPGQRIERGIDIANQRPVPEDADDYQEIVADEWNQRQRDALEHWVHSLNIVSTGSPPPTYGTESTHAEISINGVSLDFVAIRGNLHEDCIRHREFRLGVPRRPTLLVTRDHDNTPWLRREGSFLQTEAQQLDQERIITDPASTLFHVGYSNILTAFRNSHTATDLPGAINAALSA
jgi:hypothetical protein